MNIMRALLCMKLRTHLLLFLQLSDSICVKVTVLLITNFVGAEVYCLKVAL